MSADKLINQVRKCFLPTPLNQFAYRVEAKCHPCLLGANKSSKLARLLATTEPCKRVLAWRRWANRAASRLTDSQGRDRRGKIRGVSGLRVLLTHHSSPIIFQEKKPPQSHKLRCLRLCQSGSCLPRRLWVKAVAFLQFSGRNLEEVVHLRKSRPPYCN